ncbi:hypothetical protein C8F04DRAFT_1179413 [Mycena alexandri]|uniref:Uncharacterized protein n=1 Tax=Mycena alexandri TaxID=1745969 RepID=A0AAD6X7Y6_9AGAR|nr:hypothetical protein C8F04DRAFT_1179413 [Mycena alexandri]
MAASNTGQDKYLPPPLSLEVIAQDRVPWIKPPAVMGEDGNGKWEKWVQYENSTTDPTSLYIRKRSFSWKAQSKHSVWYDRSHRRVLHLRADFQVPLGVVEVETFGCPAPQDFYYEWEQSVGGRKLVRRRASYWMYRTRACSRSDANRVLARPAANRLPLKDAAAAPAVQHCHSDDEDDDDDGYSDDDDPPPMPEVRLAPHRQLIEHMEPIKARVEVDWADTSNGRTVAEDNPTGLDPPAPTPAVSVACAPEERMDIDGFDPPSKGDILVGKRRRLKFSASTTLRLRSAPPSWRATWARYLARSMDWCRAAWGRRQNVFPALPVPCFTAHAHAPRRPAHPSAPAPRRTAHALVANGPTPHAAPTPAPRRAARALALDLAPRRTVHALFANGPTPHAAPAPTPHAAPAPAPAPRRAARALAIDLAPRRTVHAPFANGPAPRRAAHAPRRASNSPVRRNDVNAPARRDDVSSPRSGEKEVRSARVVSSRRV